MSYKLAGVVWTDNGTLANKELSPLEALEKIKESPHRVFLENDEYRYVGDIYKNEIDIIETALKEYEELKFQKERNNELQKHSISLGIKIGEVEEIGKKLKALEIIKETPEFAWYVKSYENAYEMITDVKGFRVKNSVEELQEMFDLLKEVLL